MRSHLGEAGFLFPESIKRLDKSVRYGASKEDALKLHVRYTGITFPEMSRNELEEPSEEYFMENYTDKFQSGSRALYKFLYDHNDDWSFDPGRTEVRLIETGNVDPDRLTLNPPELEQNFPVKVGGGLLQSILTVEWIEHGEDHDNQSLGDTLGYANMDDPGIRQLVVDFFDSDMKTIHLEILGNPKIDFEEIGEKISGEILEMEKMGLQDLASKTADMVLDEDIGKNAMNLVPLLRSKNKNIRNAVSNKFGAGFHQEIRAFRGNARCFERHGKHDDGHHQ